MGESASRSDFRRVLSDVAGFASSRYFVRFTSLVRAFVVAKVLGPAGNGLWQHFFIISEYLEQSHLGIIAGLNKVLGHRVGRGDERGALAAMRTGTGATLGLALALTLGLLVYVALRWEELEPWDRWGLPLLGGLLVANWTVYAYQTILRAHSRIHVISVAEAAFAISNLALAVVLLFRFGVLGVLLAWLLTRLASAVWLVRRSGYGFSPECVRDELGPLLRTGFPIYLFRLTRVGLHNVDRVLVDAVLDKTQLGIYGLAVTLASLVQYAADAVGFVLYPIFLRAFGRSGDARAPWDALARGTELLALLVPLVLGLSYLVFHLPVLWLLPEFLDSIAIYRMLTVSAAFQALAVLPGFYLMSVDRQNALVPIGVAAIAFELGVGREMIAAGRGLEGVALTMGAGGFLYCTAVLLYAGRFGLGSAGRAVPWILRVYAPGVFFGAIVAGLRWLAPRTAAAEWGEAARSGTQALVFLLLTLPPLVAYERKHRILARLRHGDGPGGASSDVSPGDDAPTP